MESCLAVVILFTVVSLLLPLYAEMERQLYEAYLDVHVTEAALNGARLYRQGVTAGQFIIEGETYTWHANARQICVQYEWLAEVKQRCVQPI